MSLSPSGLRSPLLLPCPPGSLADGLAPVLGAMFSVRAHSISYLPTQRLQPEVPCSYGPTFVTPAPPGRLLIAPNPSPSLPCLVSWEGVRVGYIFNVALRGWPVVQTGLPGPSDSWGSFSSFLTFASLIECEVRASLALF